MTDGAVTAKGQQERTPAATTRQNGKGPRGMHRVRWVASSTEPEMECERCFAFLPLTVAFWNPVHGIARCRACWADVNAERLRAMRKRDSREYARDHYRRTYSTLARYRRETAA